MRAMIAILALTLAGCASLMDIGKPHQPGFGVDATFASQWGCDYDEVVEHAADAKERLPAGQRYIPQVGWTACTLMARVGVPQDIDRQQSDFGRGASWWYQTSNDMKLVSLEHQGSGWRVSYVGW